MARCKQCNIEISDHVSVCPLCNCVLEDVQETENMYPDIRFKDRKLNLLARIYLFLALLVEGLLIYLNIISFRGIYWSVITGGALAYLYLTMRFAVLHNAGYKTKIVVQTLFGIVYLIAIDWALGYRGWSLNYVLPSGIILVDVFIVVLMIVNSRNWQSYMLFQLFMILWSLIPMLFIEIGIVSAPLMSVIALISSICLFVGTFIIGGRRASTELKRRFHVR